MRLRLGKGSCRRIGDIVLVCWEGCREGMNNLSSKSLETECYSTVAEVASRGNFAPQSYPILSSSCRLALVRKLISASRATILVWSPSSGYGAWSNRASFAPVLAGRHALLRATHGVTTPSLGVSPGSSYHQTFEFSDGLFFGDAVNQSNFSGQAVNLTASQKKTLRLPNATGTA
jgi:hypothetical protein